LEEQLPGVVEAMRAGSVSINRISGAIDDQAHRFVPRGRLEPVAAADQRRCQSIAARIRLPAVEPLGPKASVVDAIAGSPADADDAPVRDPDVETATRRAEDADRWDPAVRRLGRPLVDADGPGAVMRSPGTPDVLDAVATLVGRPPRDPGLSRQVRRTIQRRLSVRFLHRVHLTIPYLQAAPIASRCDPG